LVRNWSMRGLLRWRRNEPLPLYFYFNSFWTLIIMAAFSKMLKLIQNSIIFFALRANYKHIYIFYIFWSCFSICYYSSARQKLVIFLKGILFYILIIWTNCESLISYHMQYRSCIKLPPNRSVQYILHTKHRIVYISFVITCIACISKWNLKISRIWWRDSVSPPISDKIPLLDSPQYSDSFVSRHRICDSETLINIA